MQSRNNEDLDSFYNQLEAKNHLNIGSDRNQGFLSQGKNSAGRPTATQTTNEGPNQHQSLTRPAIISQNSTSKRNAN